MILLSTYSDNNYTRFIIFWKSTHIIKKILGKYLRYKNKNNVSMVSITIHFP